jgi:putative molybdopterin biosynthesis protein
VLDVDAEVDRREFTVAARFQVAPGERLALFGPSGSGKTTTLEVIAGLLAPRRGRITLNGRVLTSTAPPRIALPPWQRRTGLLRQDPGLFPHLTVRQNLEYGARRDPRRTARLAARLGLEGLLGARPAQLSGGQAHRVAIGRLLLARCDALLLDEPYTGLDAGLRQMLTSLVRSLAADRSVPAVLVAHELTEAQAFADRLAVLDQGRIAQVGSPEEVVARPATRRVAELAGYQGFVPLAGDGGPGTVAAVHPDRVVAGAYPGRGLVLSGRVTPGGGRLVGEPGGRGPARLVPAGGAPAGRRWGRPDRHRAGPARIRGGRQAARQARAGVRVTLPAGTGLRLRLARQARGFSQQQLAGMAGVTRQALSAVEAGHSDPSLRVALALARALGMTVEELFGPGAAPAPVTVQPVAPLGGAGARVTLAPMGDSFVALPLAGDTATRAGFLPAGGIVVPGGSPEAGTAPGTVQPVAPPRPTLVVAGCDPALPLLERPLSLLEPPVGFSWWSCSSADALRLAGAGLVHAAGAHLLGEGGEYNTGPARQWLGSTGAEVIGFSSWREGLVLRPGLAGEVTSVADLARQGRRLVNREEGSEARRVLDREAARLRVDPAAISGYATRATGHLPVASAIAAGLADAGVASEPAARAYGLDFLPLAAERFDLVIPAHQAGSREVQALLRVLTSPWLLTQLAGLPGYDAARCGERVATI